MVRSIQLFTYDYPRGVGEIRNVLGSGKIIHYTRTDKRQAHFDEELELEGRITRVTNSQFGIGGHFFYRYQEIVNRHMPDEHYAISGEHFDFLLSPKHKSMIVHGASLYRDHVRHLISETTHNGDSRAFGNRVITKDQMKKLVDAIRKYNKNNDCERPHNLFLDKKWGKDELEDMDYSSGEARCVTDTDLFKKQFSTISYWSPRMRIYLLNGIVEEASNKRVKFDMKYDASFTSSHHASPEQWNRFIFETCRSPLNLPD